MNGPTGANACGPLFLLVLLLAVIHVWLVPLSPENAATLALLGVELEKNLIFTPDTGDGLEKDEKPIVPMPIKATPYQHQVRAYNFALRLFGIGGAP